MSVTTERLYPISKKELIKTYFALSGLNTRYPHDLPAIDYIIKRFKKVPDITSTQDDFGNLVADLPGNPDKPTLMLNTHVDIPESIPKIKYEKLPNGIRGTSRHKPIGADPHTGGAVLIEMALNLAKSDNDHRPIQFVFTRGEEPGLLGARALARSLVRASEGLVLDQDGPPTEVVIAGPSMMEVAGEILGKGSHTSVPELGVNAIQIFADATTRVPLGYTDASRQVTWNIGPLKGSEAINTVPSKVTFRGELRSLNHDLLVEESSRVMDVFNSTAIEAGGSFRSELETRYNAYSVDPQSPLLKKMQGVYEQLGWTPHYLKTHGASDANIFNEFMDCVAIGSGYSNPHAPNESADWGQMLEVAVFLDRFAHARQ